MNAPQPAPTGSEPAMSSKAMVELCTRHSLFSWSATGKVDPLPIARDEPGMSGVIDVMDPRPYDDSFGGSDAEIVRNNLRCLEVVIQCEGTEVMCGWGRTGKLFAFEHGGIVPDILTLAGSPTMRIPCRSLRPTRSST